MKSMRNERICMKTIGIMGGTFNPVHYGHLLLAEYAREEMQLDEIWFIPTGCSYMKQNSGILSGADRIQMVELAIEKYSEKMKCLDLEVKRGGNTYTYETLEELHAQYPNHSFSIIFGADCLFSIENWRFPEKIFSQSNVIAAVRANATLDEMNHKIEELQERFGADITLLNFPNIELSSTMIRKRIASKKSVRFMLPDSVIDYIELKGFYQDEDVTS